jgi:hypothetical protein
MKGVVKFLDVSLKGKHRLAIRAGEPFIRRENLLKLKVCLQEGFKQFGNPTLKEKKG